MKLLIKYVKFLSVIEEACSWLTRLTVNFGQRQQKGSTLFEYQLQRESLDRS